MLVYSFMINIMALTYSHIQDYYSVLGVSRNATKAEIKSGIYTSIFFSSYLFIFPKLLFLYYLCYF